MSDKNLKTKACRRCNRVFSLDCFPLEKWARDGHHGVCNYCHEEWRRRREAVKKHKTRVFEARGGLSAKLGKKTGVRHLKSIAQEGTE